VAAIRAPTNHQIAGIEGPSKKAPAASAPARPCAAPPSSTPGATHAKLCFKLGPGGFDREPQAVQTRVLDNARTMPLIFGAPAPPAITCDMLKDFPQPTLVMRGEKTQVSFVLISEAISKCIPAAQLVVLQNVNHNGPSRDPAAFTGAIFEFLSRR
jgi:pimeloyl-ACP methyl ester carboxylesterase